MSKFSAKKINTTDINNGNEYTKDDRLSLEVLNGLVNSALYSQGLVDNIQLKGEYNGVTTYKMFNLVLHNGSLYIAIKDNFIGKSPSIETTYWKLVAQKGKDGGIPDITIGSVNLSEENTPTVTNGGTPTSPILNFGIPSSLPNRLSGSVKGLRLYYTLSSGVEKSVSVDGNYIIFEKNSRDFFGIISFSVNLSNMYFPKTNEVYFYTSTNDCAYWDGYMIPMIGGVLSEGVDPIDPSGFGIYYDKTTKRIRIAYLWDYMDFANKVNVVIFVNKVS